MIPRGKYIGRRLGDPPKDEAQHFIRCPACGGWRLAIAPRSRLGGLGLTVEGRRALGAGKCVAS